MPFTISSKIRKMTATNKTVILCIALGATLLLGANGETLRGTTVLNWPYVNRLPNGQFEGYCIDLLNELAPLMGIAYTLTVAADEQCGGWVSSNGTVNGMIGEVMRGEADFAIGDLTVLSSRARFVNFTAPFLEFGLAALVRKELVADGRIRNFKDLSEQTSLRYGVKRSGANLPLFHDSPVVARMYAYMDTHASTFVADEREGVRKVKRERYAFIADSPFVEYVVQRDCTLAAIDDRRRHFQFEYAIAVALGSPLRARFSKAILALQKSGRLRELKNKYWLSNKCTSDVFDTKFVTDNHRPNNGRHVDRFKPAPDAGSQSRDKLRENNAEYNTNNNNNRPQAASGRVRQMNDNVRYPHDEVDDDDVELLKPRPERENRRRRPNGGRHQPNAAIALTNMLLIIIVSVIISLSFTLRSNQI